MAEKDASEPLVVLSTFQRELTELKAKYQTYLQALSELDVQETNSTLQHVILLESASQDVSVQLLLEHRLPVLLSPSQIAILVYQKYVIPGTMTCGLHLGRMQSRRQ